MFSENLDKKNNLFFNKLFSLLVQWAGIEPNTLPYQARSAVES